MILNFSHPLSKETIGTLGDKNVVNVPVQFDHYKSFIPQLEALTEKIEVREPLILNLPSLNTIASLVLVYVYGRVGYFPPVIRLRPVRDALPPRFEFAELLNIQGVCRG